MNYIPVPVFPEPTVILEKTKGASATNPAIHIYTQSGQESLAPPGRPQLCSSSTDAAIYPARWQAFSALRRGTDAVQAPEQAERL